MWDDVRRLALDLPATSEGTSYSNASWHARLERIDAEELRALIVEAWLARAPRRLAADWSTTHLSGSA